MTKGTHKILLADDDEAIRDSLVKVLGHEGYEVLATANGAKAVEKFRAEHGQVDLVLLDLNMPAKNGWATMDRLADFVPTPPVMIITGLPHQEKLAEAAGVSALVQKPIDVPAFLRLVRNLLNDSAGSHRHHQVDHELQFQSEKAAGDAARHIWAARNAIPFSHGGLNE